MFVAGSRSREQREVLCGVCSHVGMAAGAACQCTEGSTGACGPGNVSTQSVPDGSHMAPLALNSHACQRIRMKALDRAVFSCTILDAYPGMQQ